MIHLAARSSTAPVSQIDIADATGAPVSFLAKVLQRLATERLVVSSRGKAGGFALAARGRRCSMLDVVTAIDGPLALNSCLSPDTPCDRVSWCPAHVVWREVQRRVIEVLHAATIAGLARCEDADRPHRLRPARRAPVPDAAGGPRRRRAKPAGTVVGDPAPARASG